MFDRRVDIKWDSSSTRDTQWELVREHLKQLVGGEPTKAAVFDYLLKSTVEYLRIRGELQNETRAAR